MILLETDKTNRKKIRLDIKLFTHHGTPQQERKQTSIKIEPCNSSCQSPIDCPLRCPKCRSSIISILFPYSSKRKQNEMESYMDTAAHRTRVERYVSILLRWNYEGHPLHKPSIADAAHVMRNYRYIGLPFIVGKITKQDDVLHNCFRNDTRT